MMGKSARFIVLVAGLLMLGVGAYLQFGSTGGSDDELAASCRAEVRSRGADAEQLMTRCDDRAFAAAITATDARSAASATASANRQQTGTSALAMFLLGLGAVATLGGAALLMRRR